MYFLYDPEKECWEAFSAMTTLENHISQEISSEKRQYIEVYHADKLNVDLDVKVSINYGNQEGDE